LLSALLVGLEVKILQADRLRLDQVPSPKPAARDTAATTEERRLLDHRLMMRGAILAVLLIIGLESTGVRVGLAQGLMMALGFIVVIGVVGAILVRRLTGHLDVLPAP